MDLPTHHAPPAAFAFLETSTDPCSVEEIGLNVVFDGPSTRKATIGESFASDDGIPSSGRQHVAGSSWMTIVIASYASAITIALIWILSVGRSLAPSRHPAEQRALAVSEPATTPLSGGAVRSEEPASPLPIQNLTALGASIRLGTIEVTPLGIEKGRIELHRTIDGLEVRQPKGKSLILRLRLTNVSPDHIYTPLDLPSIRECSGCRKETYLETGQGIIAMYPLAVESEWSIAGQQLPILKPGESVETLLATAPIVENKLDGSLLWRIRLRVNPHQTDVVGVKFSKRDIAG